MVTIFVLKFNQIFSLVRTKMKKMQSFPLKQKYYYLDIPLLVEGEL